MTGILLLSVVLRLVSALYQGNGIEAMPGIHDQVSYHTLASRVLEGHGFSFGVDWWPATRAGEPTAHWSYLYTLYVAIVYLAVGVNPLAARLIQALVVAVLHPWLSWRIGRRLFGDQAGLVAAVFVAVYGYFIYYAGALMTESFYILAILWAIDLSCRLVAPEAGVRRKPVIPWVLLGIAVGSAVLLRQVFLLFTPFLIVWLIWALWSDASRNRLRNLVPGFLAACLVVILMIVPWTVRNWIAFGRLVLLNTNAGFAFFWGNHPIHGSDFIPILRGEGASYGSLIPDDVRHLDEASMDRELMQRGLRFAAQDPQRFLLLSLSRMKEYVRFWPSSDSGHAGNLIRLLSFGLFCPFMILGLLVVSVSFLRQPATERSGPGGFHGKLHILLVLFIVICTVVQLLTWTLIRYRLPVDSALILYAAAGAVWLADHLPVLRMVLPRKRMS